MAGRYIDVAALQEHAAPHVVAQTTDDDDDGTPDDEAVERVIFASEALVDGKLRGVYMLPLIAPIDPLVVTAALMVAFALLVRRHPEYIRNANGAELLKEAIAFLDAIRTNGMTIDHPRVTGSGVPDVLSEEPRGFGAISGEYDDVGSRP